MKRKAERAKDSFLNLLTFDFTKTEIKSFKTIEYNWLISIDIFENFESFLKKVKKIIKTVRNMKSLQGKSHV